MIWSVAVSAVAAQEYYGGYRFAPQSPVPAGEPGTNLYQGQTRPGAEPGWTDPSMPLTGPGGRPYRFRNGYEMQQGPQQPVFRPDTQLGQQPKNWSTDPGWATDPVLQQGLVFRPLSRKGEGSGRRERRAVTAPVAPPAYPYPPGGATGGYPGLFGSGIIDDPVTGLPIWPVPGTYGDWAPGW